MPIGNKVEVENLKYYGTCDLKNDILAVAKKL